MERGHFFFPGAESGAGMRDTAGARPAGAEGAGTTPQSPQPGAGVLGRALPGSGAAVPPRSTRVSFRKGAGSARCRNPTGKRGMLSAPSFLLTASPRRPSGTPRTCPGSPHRRPRSPPGNKWRAQPGKPPTAGTGWLRMGRFSPLLSPNKGTGTASVAVKPHLHRRRNFPEGLALD